MRHLASTFILLLLTGALLFTGCGAPDNDGSPNDGTGEPTAEAATKEEPPKSAGYDPAADPTADLAAAIEQAATTGQRILLEVGGEWCVWCHRLEAFIHQNPEIEEALERNYIVVKVNYSDENENTEFLRGYPGIAGYPHIFILDAEGNLLHSQDTGELEADQDYDRAKMMEFLTAWAPPELAPEATAGATGEAEAS